MESVGDMGKSRSWYLDLEKCVRTSGDLRPVEPPLRNVVADVIERLLLNRIALGRLMTIATPHRVTPKLHNSFGRAERDAWNRGSRPAKRVIAMRRSRSFRWRGVRSASA